MTSAPPLLILASGGKLRLRRVRIPVPTPMIILTHSLNDSGANAACAAGGLSGIQKSP